jgi:uncharacterized protein
MTTFQEVKKKCPACGNSVPITLLTSMNTFGGKTTDLRSMSAGFDPLQFMVNMCKVCGFAEMGAFEDAEVSAELREFIAEELTPLVEEAATDVAMQYAFCAKIAEFEGADANVISNYYLRAAWCCDAYDLRTHEVAYRLRTVEYMRKVLTSEDMQANPSARLNLLYLIGEMYRRANDPVTAAEWFNAAIHEAETSSNKSHPVIDLARQQRDDPQEFL